MPDAVGLMQALLGPRISEDEARNALSLALSGDDDPLHWCAARCGLSPAEIMRRAAAWAGLPFLDAVPELDRSAGLGAAPRLDHLAGLRLVSHAGPDGSVAIAAPDFAGILRLRHAVDQNPALRHRIMLVPLPSLRQHLAAFAAEDLIDAARQTTVRHWPYATAQLDLTRPARWAFAALLVALAMLVIAAPLMGQLWLAPVWVVLMALPTALRLAALATPPEDDRPFPPIADADLPTYSVLVPLRDEANMVDQLCAAIGRINYPPEKLQVIFAVESRSPETVASVRRHLGDARFSLVVIPDAAPRTKPKALNFALPFCTGEFVVVFDAEDRPDPGQLRQIVSEFRRHPEAACIQARLLIANGGAGPLSGLFVGEYAGLFAVFLPALAQWGSVVPLGGTSNHFRLDVLRRLGGWDAFNVTEDADLGVRLARLGLRTRASVTVTLEDAPVKLRAWMGQRTRWLKGWLQTFLVHNRRPRALLAHLGWRKFVLFELVILSVMLAPLLHIPFVPLVVWMAFTGADVTAHAGPWTLACIAMLFVSYGVALAVNIVGLQRTGQMAFLPWQALLPLHWLLVACASVLALRDFVFRPFHWFKTPHQVSMVVGPTRGGTLRPNPAE